ncbi:tetraspanin-9-like [Danaus plexippus]|uniref:Uncharacterized protein n=1 Tax=Danaus plexippus plexippus TaxID=278856 RepID=A0A212EX21_DANPL|nr:tetraspanin-9-like [Danaus plexippus]OWR46033.1 hypothetical protein KGM_200741 [Danaus plexippus plexippus]
MKSSSLVLFVCAGLLLSGGAILGGSATWSLMRISYYFWTTDLGVELGSSVLFISGALLCLPTCWLCTLVPYHPRSISLLASLMILVTSGLMLLSIGISSIMGLSRAVREQHTLNTTMLRTMAFEPVDIAVRSAFASMQLELKCCGVNSHTDWYLHRNTLPLACCGRVGIGKNTDHCEIPLYNRGCLRPARAELRMYANSLAVLACAIILVKAVALFATVYTMVTGVTERSLGVKQQPLRIAYLPAPPIVPLAPPAP